jgi:drug/metabolite transporter (DMT)-like permease
MKNIVLIFIVSASTVASQLLLKKGVMGLDLSHFSLYLVRRIACSPLIIVCIIIQFCSFAIWLVVISKTTLGYALGFAGAFLYLLIPLLSRFIYGERLTTLQWIGLFFISAGIFCMAKGDFVG